MPAGNKAGKSVSCLANGTWRQAKIAHQEGILMGFSPAQLEINKNMFKSK